MIDCLVLGDSIAVGLYQKIPQCESLSKGGWNTWQWNRDYLKYDLTAQTVIISLGSNDHKGIKTQEELERLREKVTAGRVFWILGVMQYFWYQSDRRREKFVKICEDRDVQRLTFESYMNKELARKDPMAHVRIFFKDMAHLLGLART